MPLSTQATERGLARAAASVHLIDRDHSEIGSRQRYDKDEWVKILFDSARGQSL